MFMKLEKCLMISLRTMFPYLSRLAESLMLLSKWSVLEELVQFVSRCERNTRRTTVNEACDTGVSELLFDTRGYGSSSISVEYT